MKIKIIALALLFVGSLMGACAHKTCPTYSKNVVKTNKIVRV